MTATIVHRNTPCTLHQLPTHRIVNSLSLHVFGHSSKTLCQFVLMELNLIMVLHYYRYIR